MDHPKDHSLFGLGLPGIHIYNLYTCVSYIYLLCQAASLQLRLANVKWEGLTCSWEIRKYAENGKHGKPSPITTKGNLGKLYEQLLFGGKIGRFPPLDYILETFSQRHYHSPKCSP